MIKALDLTTTLMMIETAWIFNVITHLLAYLLTHSLTHSLTGSSELYGKVRFFSPKESLRVAGFPSNFTFPSTILLKNQYAGTLLLTYSLTHSLTHLLSHSLIHLLSHSLTHLLTHSLFYSK